MCNLLYLDSKDSMMPKPLNAFFFDSILLDNEESVIANYRNKSNVNYLLWRKVAIDNIKQFNCSKGIYYKALCYLDRLYLSSNIDIKYLADISSICVLLAYKFNESQVNSKLKDILRSIKNNKRYSFYPIIEMKILKMLQYHLCYLTAYDYINIFFTNNMIVNLQKRLGEQMYISTINFIDSFSNDNRFCNFTPYIIAVSILYFLFKGKISTFDYYNIFYHQCLFILNVLYGCNNIKVSPYKNKSKPSSKLSSCSTIDN